MHIIWSLARNVTNELVAGWCTTERVKRLASNEIELGMKIPTIKSRASNIPMTKGSIIRIRGNQYEHPGSAIGYWEGRCFGHVYIVLEPIGSSRLKYDDDRYYMSYVFWWPKVVRSPGWDHGHDEESRNGREVKIDILEGYIQTPEWFRRGLGIFSEYREVIGTPRES